MSSVLQSLFQGTSPPGVNTYTQNLSNVPTWLMNSDNALVQQANAVANQGYQAYQGPQVAPWTQAQNQALGEVQGMQGSYLPTLQTAAGMTLGASNPAAFQGAYGMIPQAQNLIQNSITPGMAQMNPYINNVIGNAETQASQYFQNQLQPQINAQFTAGGNFGSAANQNAQQLAANQLTENITSQGLGALASGYQNAQQAGLAGGQALGTLSQLQGGLGYEQGILGLQGAGTLGNLAQTGQGLGLQGAGTLYNIGQQQQQQGQQNLNTQYQNFLNQTYYPQQQLSWLSGIVNGATPAAGSMTSGTNAGYLPGSTYGPSPLQSSAGLYSGLSALGGG
jgi:hypothetical protein